MTKRFSLKEARSQLYQRDTTHTSDLEVGIMSGFPCLTGSPTAVCARVNQLQTWNTAVCIVNRGKIRIEHTKSNHVFYKKILNHNYKF